VRFVHAIALVPRDEYGPRMREQNVRRPCRQWVGRTVPLHHRK
jgi:hypothetical protein